MIQKLKNIDKLLVIAYCLIVALVALFGMLVLAFIEAWSN